MTAAEGERVLGLVPAKGGSTRLPYKNLAEVGGRSLLARALDALGGSGLCSRTFVSTEDAGVRERALALGAEAPFLRPDWLARDPAGIVEVALHALDWLESEEGAGFDTMIIAPPTCPFRTADDVIGAYALYTRHRPNFVMTVTECTPSPYMAFRLDAAQTMSPLFPEMVGRKTTELPAAYTPNGAVHVLDVARFREVRSYYAEPLFAHVMPWERSLDVDTETDLRLARAFLQAHGDPGAR